MQNGVNAYNGINTSEIHNGSHHNGLQPKGLQQNGLPTYGRGTSTGAQNGLNTMRPPLPNRVPRTNLNPYPRRPATVHTENGLSVISHGEIPNPSVFTQNFVKKTVRKLPPKPSSSVSYGIKIEDDDRSCIIVEDDMVDKMSPPPTKKEKKVDVSNWLRSSKPSARPTRTPGYKASTSNVKPSNTPGYIATAIKLRNMRLKRAREMKRAHTVGLAKAHTSQDLKRTPKKTPIVCKPCHIKKEQPVQSSTCVSDIDSDKVFATVPNEKRPAAVKPPQENIKHVLAYARQCLLYANDANTKALVSFIFFSIKKLKLYWLFYFFVISPLYTIHSNLPIVIV